MISSAPGIIATLTKVNRLTFKSTHVDTRNATMFEYQVAQAAFRICRCLMSLFFVGNIDEKFDDARVLFQYAA